MSLTREQHAEMRRKGLEEEARRDRLVANLEAVAKGKTDYIATLAREAAALIEQMRPWSPCSIYLLTADMKPAHPGDRLWHPNHTMFGILPSLKEDRVLFRADDGRWTCVELAAECWADLEAMNREKIKGRF